MEDPVVSLNVFKFLDLLQAVKLLSSEEHGALRKAKLPVQEAWTTPGRRLACWCGKGSRPSMKRLLSIRASRRS